MLSVVDLGCAGGLEDEAPACMCRYSSKDPAQGLKDATIEDIPRAAELLAVPWPFST